MSKLWLSTLAAVQVAGCAGGGLTEFTLSGGCDELVAPTTFVKLGVTLNGAPYFKAKDAELFMYWDPDCSGSTDGTPRWIVDHDSPLLDLQNDLDSDGSCGYMARIDWEDKTEPPAEGVWQMSCGDQVVSRALSRSSAPTSTRPPSGLRAGAIRTEETESLKLSGACPAKAWLNDKVFERVGYTADARPYYKARGCDTYMYYDVDCDGDGPMYTPRWVIDDSKPGTSASEDLDGDHRCQYHARSDSSTFRPLAFATWKMYCGSEWVSVDLVLEVQETTTTTVQTATGSADCRGASVFIFISAVLLGILL